MTTQAGHRYTGTSVKRTEDPRILTGRGRYVDDVALPQMLHGAFLRSPHAHALLKSIDVSKARVQQGVVAVYTGEEMESLIEPGQYNLLGYYRLPAHAHSLMATDKVRFAGDSVALVVAENRYLAEDACELIDVHYEVLPAVMDASSALVLGAPIVFEDHGSNVAFQMPPVQHGDVDSVFANADRVLSYSIAQHRQQNVPMETRGIVASYDPSLENLTVHTSTQGVAAVATVISDRLGLPIESVQVLAGDVGGSFGLKGGASREDVAVCVAARETGRTVKWIEDRDEHMLASGQAREETVDVDVAVTNDGDIKGLKIKILLDAGAYPGIAMLIASVIEEAFPGPYKIEAMSYEFTAAITNKPMYVPYRAPFSVATFVRERVIDLIATDLGQESIDLRLRNLVDGVEPRSMTTGRTLVGCTALESVELVTSEIDIAEFRKRQRAARADGRHLGLGIATFIEAAPGPRHEAPHGAETVRLKLMDNGELHVFTGQMPHGQSHETSFAQIAADQFGVEFDQVKVIVGDTELVPPGYTGGSRAAAMAGGATLMSARILK